MTQTKSYFAMLLFAMSITVGTAFADGSMVNGEVESIDVVDGTITLKHGPIKNLEMTAMTMALRVKDPSMLKTFKVGDQVQFEAERLAEGVTITMMNKIK